MFFLSSAPAWAPVADNSVNSRSIINGQVKAADIAKAAIRAAHIANGAITSAKIADGTIVNADISALAGISASKINRTGLDADLLDGQQANDFVQKPKPTAQQVAMLKWYEAGNRVNFPVGTSPTSIAFDGTNIWTANGGSNNVTMLRAWNM